MAPRLPTPRRAAVAAVVGLVVLAAAACSPAADAPEETAEAPPPRITAEHPVTSRPALEAGLLDGGAAGGGPLLGGAGSVDGLASGSGDAALGAFLPADDLAESIDFYTTLLGFDVAASEPDEPPFQRVELARGGARLVLLSPERWAREMPRLAGGPAEGGTEAGTESSADGGAAAGDDNEAAEAAGEGAGNGAPGNSGGDGSAAEDEGSPAPSDGAVVGPVLRLAMEDLAAIAERLAVAGVEVLEDGGGAGGTEVPGARGGHRLAIADPAGNRLLLVPVAAP